ncbi:hypothetical protein HYDPIDRAFT_107192 [Hydnomerulius pinastri MD-312]|nr:hypothetical protein HYDPIDRAFT_107192 [Hydnomerulius pinastri MD-312]
MAHIRIRRRPPRSSILGLPLTALPIIMTITPSFSGCRHTLDSTCVCLTPTCLCLSSTSEASLPVRLHTLSQLFNKSQVSQDTRTICGVDLALTVSPSSDHFHAISQIAPCRHSDVP